MLNNPSPGYGNVADYQAAGLPWLKTGVISGIVEYDFPTVTKSITVVNNSPGVVSLGFSFNGVKGSNRFDINSTEPLMLDVRTNRFFLSGSGASVSVYAALTTIGASQCPPMSGSTCLELQGIG